MQGRGTSRKIYLSRLFLFKLVTTPDRESVHLAIPEICADKIITLYHSSLFGTSVSDKNVSYYLGQILYTRSYALLTFIHQRMPHMSIGKE